MYDVEVKIKIKKEDNFLEQLEEIGAEYKLDMENIDSYYNMPDGLRDFKDTDEALRVRKNTEYIFDQESNKEIISVSGDLTYKGPKIDKDTKSRIEYLTEVSDFEAINMILITLGFKKIISVKKKRILYKIQFENEEIHIVFDKIQFLDGEFAEFEIITEKKEEILKKKALIFNLMNRLGYEKEESITKSYLELIVNLTNNK